MKTYRLPLEKNGWYTEYLTEHDPDRYAICGEFVKLLLGSNPPFINVTVATEPFNGSLEAAFEDDDGDYWVKIKGDWHAIYESTGVILKELTKDSGGTFHFKIEEAK